MLNPWHRKAGMPAPAQAGVLDLQTRRNMTEFFRLAGWKAIDEGPVVEVREGAIHTLIEVESARVTLTLSAEVGADWTDDEFLAVLARLPPPLSGGLPIRASRIGTNLYLSCTSPPPDDAYRWFRIHRLLLRLLQTRGATR